MRIELSTGIRIEGTAGEPWSLEDVWIAFNEARHLFKGTELELIAQLPIGNATEEWVVTGLTDASAALLVEREGRGSVAIQGADVVRFVIRPVERKVKAARLIREARRLLGSRPEHEHDAADLADVISALEAARKHLLK